ncbi:sugar porter family MFS transporter [Roseomonas elaeocarpi]|uniref:Sugar porter family MFS transporter n=1 Tax=Roseomonas elaeocarpi TaxID=907779 RepID=A0ABV6JYK7_9PROT
MAGTSLPAARQAAPRPSPSGSTAPAHPLSGGSGFLLAITAVMAIAGFLYGYDTGIISGALLQITDEFALDHRLQEVVTASILVGAVLGAFATGWLSERLGRRWTVMIVAAVFCLGALWSSLAGSATQLALARVFLGLAVGGSSQVVPVYIAELAPAAQRGRLVITFNLAIGAGILLANVVGVALHELWSWRSMIAVAILPAALLLAAMLRLPESPRWLVERDRVEEAARALSSVRVDDGTVTQELRAIREVARQERRDAAAGWRTLAQPWLRPALVAALGVAAFTQLSGLEMMIYYTPTILAGAGFSQGVALWSSLSLAAMYVVMTFLGRLVVDRIGRRGLMLVMIPGTVVSLAVLGALFRAGLANDANAWLVVGALLVFMLFNAGGIQVVGWLLGSEMFPLSIRGKASSLHAATLWGSNLVVTATALTLVHYAGVSGMMWTYAALNLVSFVFVLRCVPETAGRSLEEIETSLREGRFLPWRPGRHVAPSWGRAGSGLAEVACGRVVAAEKG